MKRQPMVVSSMLARAGTPRRALPITNGARVIDLDAARDGEVGIAGTDRRARREPHRVQARGAEAIDGARPAPIRQARQQQRHARDVAVVLAGLVGAAQIHLVEGRPVDTGMPLHQRLERNRAPDRRPALSARAAGIPADRRADGVAEKASGIGIPENRPLP